MAKKTSSSTGIEPLTLRSTFWFSAKWLLSLASFQHYLSTLVKERFRRITLRQLPIFMAGGETSPTAGLTAYHYCVRRFYLTAFLTLFESTARNDSRFFLGNKFVQRIIVVTYQQCLFLIFWVSTLETKVEKDYPLLKGSQQRPEVVGDLIKNCWNNKIEMFIF